MLLKNKFDYLGDSIIQYILEFYQYKYIIHPDKNLSEYEINEIIKYKRKLLIASNKIKTDLSTLFNFSLVCRRFNQIIKNDIGKLLFTIHYNSNIINTNKLEHISYCLNTDCYNICHYVNKDIKHSNIIKKIALNKFNELKKNSSVKDDIIPYFITYLTPKQIESYYRIKKMDKKLKEYYEKTKSYKSSKLDSISIDTQYT